MGAVPGPQWSPTHMSLCVLERLELPTQSVMSLLSAVRQPYESTRDGGVGGRAGRHLTPPNQFTGVRGI